LIYTNIALSSVVKNRFVQPEDLLLIAKLKYEMQKKIFGFLFAKISVGWHIFSLEYVNFE